MLNWKIQTIVEHLLQVVLVQQVKEVTILACKSQ